ncbi:MAG: matrixin family metalloprotease [Chloroflexi bacterium]|nr:matrixin family metalloprotease [Chloroflexota bacterium]
MNISKLILPALALATAGAMLMPLEQAEGFSTIGGNLNHTKRHLRAYNNFGDFNANSNQTAHPNFPGALGAPMAIWKGAVEWGTKHADGTGDPHQTTTLGSGNSNFEPFWAGEVIGTGGPNGNIVSTIPSCNGGTLAYTETPISDGWRIRFCENWNWHGGPQTSISGVDIQGVMAHEYGHALGLGHTGVSGSTMTPSISGTGVGARSIAADDIAGVQFIYGVISASKPRITGISINANTVTIIGDKFSPTGNEVRFTRASSSADGNPVLLVPGLPSTGGGSLISLTIPADALPGHIAVRRNATSLDSVSNPWPFDATGSAGCKDVTSNYCQTTPNSVGSGALISYAGSTSITGDNFILQAVGLPPNQNGLFYYGPNETLAAFGNGVRCVGGSTFRLPVVLADFLGDISHQVDFSAIPAGSGAGQIHPGSQWKFQAWYRDPDAGGAGFNLSDGLSVTFCP